TTGDFKSPAYTDSATPAQGHPSGTPRWGRGFAVRSPAWYPPVRCPLPHDHDEPRALHRESAPSYSWPLARVCPWYFFYFLRFRPFISTICGLGPLDS